MSDVPARRRIFRIELDRASMTGAELGAYLIEMAIFLKTENVVQGTGRLSDKKDKEIGMWWLDPPELYVPAPLPADYEERDVKSVRPAEEQPSFPAEPEPNAKKN